MFFISSPTVIQGHNILRRYVRIFMQNITNNQ